MAEYRSGDPIARRGNVVLIIDDVEKRVGHTEGGMTGDSKSDLIDTFLKFGYWEEILPGHKSAEDIADEFWGIG